MVAVSSSDVVGGMTEVVSGIDSELVKVPLVSVSEMDTVTVCERDNDSDDAAALDIDSESVGEILTDSEEDAVRERDGLTERDAESVKELDCVRDSDCDKDSVLDSVGDLVCGGVGVGGFVKVASEDLVAVAVSPDLEGVSAGVAVVEIVNESLWLIE